MRICINRLASASPAPGVPACRKNRAFVPILALFASFFIGFAQKAAAQCEPVCKPPFELSFQSNACITPILTIPQVLQPGFPAACLGGYTMAFFMPDGITPLTQPFDGTLAGVPIMTVITYSPNGKKDTTFITPMDKSKPVLTCKDTVVACVQALDPTALGKPILFDNCASQAWLKSHLLFNDNLMMAGNCATSYSKIILRFWNTVDSAIAGQFPNSGSCLQKITVQKPDIDDVEIPLYQATLEQCHAGQIRTNLAATGQPTINGLNLLGSNCGFKISYTDELTSFCNPSDSTWNRIWTVILPDTCLNKMDTVFGQQLICLKDLDPPLLNCPADLTVGTDAGFCMATVNLQNILAMDYCNGNLPAIPSWAWGFGPGDYGPIPIGTYPVTYSVDDCNSTSTCTFNLTVKDIDGPTIFLNPKTVGLPINGLLKIAAADLVEDVFDNCHPNGPFLYKVDRGQGFMDSLCLSCDDVGAVGFSVMVCSADDPTDCSMVSSFINVQDKIGPKFPLNISPKDVTVSCTNPNLYNLPFFGEAKPWDSCGILSNIYSEDKEVSNCGIGFIIRRWTATDVNGNSSTWTQKITVINDDPFKPTDIVWPADLTKFGCTASLDPANLPPGFDKPIFTGQFCGMPVSTKTDSKYDNNAPACWKIVRKWKVIDWCNYDPATDSPKFEHYQILTVMDTSKPVLHLPADLTVSLGATCQNGSVPNTVKASATDCNPVLNWKQLLLNGSPNPFATNNLSPNLAGTYPPGITQVKIIVGDGCGNESVGVVKITVSDIKPPVPVCVSGLSVNLVKMGDDVIMVMLDAETFNQSSYDNCTSPGKLKFFIRVAGLPNPVPPTTTSIAFNCGDEGTQIIELWVQDEAGNADFCTTYIIVQDNDNWCPVIQQKAVISGEIATETGENVEKATIELLNSTASLPVNTDVSGAFSLLDLPTGQSYTIHPMKNDDPLNGLSTFDLVKLQKHILGIAPFTSPWQWIAGDINKNGSVTTFDVLELRKLILGVNLVFPQNTSWRFVDSAWNFDTLVPPLSQPFPEMKTVSLTGAGDASASFVGVKIGDLNNSAQANSDFTGNPTDDRSDDELPFILNETAWKAGDLVEISLKTRDFTSIEALQFTLDFDADRLEFIDLPTNDATRFSDENFGFSQLENGLLSMSWSAPGGLDLSDDTPIFNLKMRAKTDGSLAESIRLNSRLTAVEAWSKGDKRRKPTLAFLQNDGSILPEKRPFEVFQNVPNPFRDETAIGFQLPENEAVTLKIFDSAGRLVFLKTDEKTAGYQEFLLTKKDLPTTGLFIYRIETASGSQTRKLIIE